MILKNPRVLLWVALIILAIVFIGPNPNPSGYRVTAVTPGVPESLKVGTVLYEINGQKVDADLISQNYTGTIKLLTGSGDVFVRANGTLGIDADPVPSTNLMFGLDIKGGTHALIRVNDSDPVVAEQVKSTLSNRINFFGLKETVFRTVSINGQNYIDISIAGGSKQELINLLQTEGKFEGKIVLSASSLNLDNKYNITFNGSDAIIGGTDVPEGASVQLDGINFTYNGKDGSRANLTADIFSGTDIRIVYIDPQHSRIQNTGTSFEWSFGIQISPESASRFARVTKNSPAIGGYLDAKIYLYLDGKLIDSLNIASSLKGKVETEISVSGGAPSAQDASLERSRLQAVLRSGALPSAVDILSIDTISPTLGSGFIGNALLAGLGAILGVVIIIFIRYRKLTLVVPMIVTSLSEVLMIIGFATALKWTIDLAAIAAIIATVGTGVNAQIIIIDQTLRGGAARMESMREKFKRAFFIIFGSAGTMIAAMLPLLFSPFSLLKGFAIVTMIGVLVGVLVARPAFSVIVEKFLKGKEHERSS